MRNGAENRLALLGYFSLFLFFLLIPFRLAAQDGELKVAETENIDAVLLLDASASMRMTDPQRLRDQGAKLFTEFLKSEDRLAIVEFADQAKIIRPLSNFNSENRSEVTAQIEKVGNSGLYTDLLAGINVAWSVLKAQTRPDARPVIVLFSDGMMEPDPEKGIAAEFTDKLLFSVIPELKARGVRIHTLAFSSLADKELLSQIAASSEGMSWFTPEADRIHEAFANLFLAVKKPQIVPLTGRGFRIDQNVTEATFYINREDQEDLFLVTPSAVRLSAAGDLPGVKWFQGKQFDVVTVTNPEVGDWQVSGLASRDSFATVLTNLKLVTSWPNSVKSGEKVLLQARLYEADKPVLLPEMSEVARYAFQITPTDKVSPPIIRAALNDDGRDGDRVARDGIFSALVELEEPGEYRLNVIARLPTFERSQQIPFGVKPRLVSVNIISSEKEVEPDSDQSTSADYFEVLLSADAVRLISPDVGLYAVDKNRRRLKIPLQESGSKNRLLASVSVLPEEGVYSVHASFAASDRRGRRVEATSNIIQYVLQTKAEAVAVVEEVAVVPEKVAVKKEPANWPYFVVVFLVNALFGGFSVYQVKAGQSIGSISVPEFVTPPEVLSCVEGIREKLATAEIDFDDPRFSEEALSQLQSSSAPSQSEVEAKASLKEDSDRGGQEGQAEVVASEESGAEQQEAEQPMEEIETTVEQPETVEEEDEAEEQQLKDQ